MEARPITSTRSEFRRKRRVLDLEETALVGSNAKRKLSGEPHYPSQPRNPNETERLALSYLKGIPAELIVRWLQEINESGFRNDGDAHQTDQEIQNILQEPAAQSQAAPWANPVSGPGTSICYPGPELPDFCFNPGLPTANLIGRVSPIPPNHSSQIHRDDYKSQDSSQVLTRPGPAGKADQPQWACTLCKTKKFKGKPEWKRHQENFHFRGQIGRAHV